MLTKRKIINLFKKHRIGSRKEAEALGMELRRTGSGAFREVYIINKNVPKHRLVVKFPLETPKYGSRHGDIVHSQNEIDAIWKIKTRKKLAFMRPFLPKVYYENYRAGVVLMECYYKLRQSKAYMVATVLNSSWNAASPESDDADIQYYNIMCDKTGDNFVLIDLGLL